MTDEEDKIMVPLTRGEIEAIKTILGNTPVDIGGKDMKTQSGLYRMFGDLLKEFKDE